MKNSKLLVLGLIALVLAGGLALASCGENCPGESYRVYDKDDYSKRKTAGEGWCNYKSSTNTKVECEKSCILDRMKGAPKDLYCNCN